jgi:hypothetical protein
MLATTAGLSAFAIMALSPGCSADQCTVGADFQCAQGDICYQGQCRHSCNAGNEGVTTCMADSDCKGTLNHCVTGQLGAYCSACSAGETCIPELGICQQVEIISRPDASPNCAQPICPIPLPLDGGAVDGNNVIHQHLDAGAMMQQQVTHVGGIFIEQTTDFVMDGPGATDHGVASASFFDLRGTGARLVSNTTVAADNGCRVEHGNCYSTNGVCLNGPLPFPAASIGSITVGNDSSVCAGLLTPNNMPLMLMLSFNAGMYTAMPTVFKLGLSNLPNMGGSCSIIFSGSGNSAAPDPVASVWGGSTDHTYNLNTPFRLQPDAATLTMLQMPIAITSTPRDLNFNFNQISTQPVPELVRAQMTGKEWRIVCEQDERDPTTFMNKISMHAGLIETFRQREGITLGSNTVVPVTLERAVEAQLPIPGVKTMTTTTAIDCLFRIGDLFVGSAVF